MADPYATDAPDLSARPIGPAPWASAVVERGGAILGDEPRVLSGARLVVVHCRGVGSLAPVARVFPELATLLWLEHAAPARSATAGNGLLGVLRSLEIPLFALKQGWVAGPPDRPGCFEVGASMVEAVLDADLGDSAVTWERDPDFGYEVPAEVPGLDPASARALLPRLLYGDHDRAYEHARLVAAKKRERWEIARSLDGLNGAVAAASGWPPAPTAGSWHE